MQAVLSNPTTALPIQWPQTTSWNTMQWKWDALCIASWCLTPVCGLRENLYRFSILDKTANTTVQTVQQAASLVLGFVLYALLTPFTTPLGLAIRALVSLCSQKPYIYIESNDPGKTLPATGILSLASYNMCLMPGGYSITDGQVTPPSNRQRLENNIQLLKKMNTDIICLFEVEDACDAAYLSNQLSPDYPFIIPVAGFRTIGPSSMIYIASKYQIDPKSIQFVPFVKGTELTGRASHSEKGVLSFDILHQNDTHPLAHLVATHLQHSEIPAEPQEDEISARKIQMKKILSHIQKEVNQGRKVIFTGDLNQDEKELKRTLQQFPNLVHRDPACAEDATWCGDRWCAKLMEKPGSSQQVLDYTLTNCEISTRIISQDTDDTVFDPNLLSDHFPVVSEITLTHYNAPERWLTS